MFSHYLCTCTCALALEWECIVPYRWFKCHKSVLQNHVWMSFPFPIVIIEQFVFVFFVCLHFPFNVLCVCVLFHAVV